MQHLICTDTARKLRWNERTNERTSERMNECARLGAVFSKSVLVRQDAGGFDSAAGKRQGARAKECQRVQDGMDEHLFLNMFAQLY